MSDGSYYPNTYVEQDPASKQTLLQRYTPNVGQYLPDTVRNFLTQALGAGAALGFRGPIMGGRLTPQDFTIARQLDRSMPRALMGQWDAAGQPVKTPIDPGFAATPSNPLGEVRAPYDQALIQQQFGRGLRPAGAFRRPTNADFDYPAANDPAAGEFGVWPGMPARPRLTHDWRLIPGGLPPE